jgi:heme-degrading monooxygenase HmoA
MAQTYTSGWTVKPGADDDFVASWREFVQWAAGMPGSQTFRLVRDTGQPQRYLSLGLWDSSEAQNAWRQQPDFMERLGRVRAHCDDFQTTTYEVVTDVS